MRLSQLAEYDPHIVFLQECRPVANPSTAQVVCSRTINGGKGIALLLPSASAVASRGFLPLGPPEGCGRAAVAAQFVAPIPLTVVGVWAQGPDYVYDVLLNLRAHAHLLRTGHGVVFGDFNSGSRLGRAATLTRDHRHVLNVCNGLGLVSAYHAFHHVDAGNEAHATYFHQFKRSKPWHIDFCFIPRAWNSRLIHVAVVDGRTWATRSDHRPLLVDVDTT
jgi:endonuclease/exonuclease/phosphatase family metal-dependent hydrolase